VAQDTSKEHRNLALYEIYVRNHGPNGVKMRCVENHDQPRIMASSNGFCG